MRNYTRSVIAILCTALVCGACTKETGTSELLPNEQLLVIPEGYPEMVFPEDNSFSQKRYELGKKLFFDPILSSDSSLSCGSCHQPGLAFSDNIALTSGVNNAAGVRNVPSLTNVGYQPYFTREGGVPTLEMHVLVPIQEQNEFNFNIVLIAERLKQNETYVILAKQAYDRSPDSFVITRALATFERTLISGNSRYDQYNFQGKSDALNSAELSGLDLFFSEELACSSCHSGFNFTNYAFENNGLYESYPDEGRMRFTKLESDRAKFKVPTLRNVALTAPYMFDGSLATLQDVVNHYNSGGYSHPNKSELIKPLGLSEIEKSDLVAFLKSLTDEEFVSNSNHYPN